MASTKSLLSSLFSPAVGLAILGTGAFIFSFYRAGQLATLVLPKDFPRSSPHQQASEPAKIDIKSRALLVAVDTSDPARLAAAGDTKRAVTEALKNLTDNSPTDVANIVLTGDICSAVGNKEDRDLGFALLARAVAMVPENQYLACRYAQRMAAAGQFDRAVQSLSNLLKSHPQANGIRLVLAKTLWQQGKTEEAINELLKMHDGDQLSAREQEEAGLMFVKAGRIYDGYKLFRQSMSGKPETRFYASYYPEALGQSVDDYRTALAVIDANLNNGPHSDLLALEIKRGALLLFLDRSKDAQVALQQANTKHPNNFDLQVLLSAAKFAAGDSDQALAGLEVAAKNYQPRF